MGKLLVWRKHLKEVQYPQIGDQIDVPLSYGIDYPFCSKFFTATIQKVKKDRVLVLFDECVMMRKMNEDPNKEGGFEASDLKKWLNEGLLPCFPKWMQPLVQEITIPSMEEFFDEETIRTVQAFEVVTYEPVRNDGLLELMKERHNRVAYHDCMLVSGWLRNAVSGSSPYFAEVGRRGDLTCLSAEIPNGVRPMFWLLT